MTGAFRTWSAAVVCALLLGLVVWGFCAMPPFGHYPGPYGNIIDNVASTERKLPNAISAVNFDYRGVDTMGEEYILFAAVAGITMVLRYDRRRATRLPLAPANGRSEGRRTDALRAFSLAGIPLVMAFGIYLAIHPHLTPGGGFQGAAMLATFVTLTVLGVGYTTFERTTDQERFELGEGIGAGTFAVIGLITLVISGAFLANVMPLGHEGELFSAGTIPLINTFVALEVFAGFVLMFLEFARETRVEQEKEDAPA